MTSVPTEFRQQLELLLPRLRRFARGLTSNQDQADDLVQQACEKALLKHRQWQEGTKLHSWMYRIIQNQHIDNLRRDKNTVLSGDKDELLNVPDPQGDHVPETKEMASKVAEIIQQLPRDQREVIVLVAVEGHSYREVADLLKIPKGTVMSRLFRARIAILSVINEESALTLLAE